MVVRGQAIVFLAVFADVHMHHLEILLQQGSHVRLMKCLVKHVAVITPVRTEDQEDALMCFLGLGFSLLDLESRVRVFVVKVGIRMQGRGHLHNIGVPGYHNAPAVRLFLPRLVFRDITCS